MRILRFTFLLVVFMAAALCLAQEKPLEAAATRIDQIMRAHYTAGDFNGDVLVAREGHIVYERGLGFANLEWRIPNDLTTRFEIGSMTKQFTAMLVLQQVKDGKIALDGHLSEYLPYYRRDTGSRVTISQLLSHTAGIPSFTEVPGFLEGPASRTKYRVKQFVQAYCSGDLRFEPGTRF